MIFPCFYYPGRYEQVFKLIPLYFTDGGSEDITEQTFIIIDQLKSQHRGFGFSDTVVFGTTVQFSSACSLYLRNANVLLLHCNISFFQFTVKKKKNFLKMNTWSGFFFAFQLKWQICQSLDPSWKSRSKMKTISHSFKSFIHFLKIKWSQ